MSKSDPYLLEIRSIAKELGCSLSQVELELIQAMLSFKLELLRRGYKAENFFDAKGNVLNYWKPWKSRVSEKYLKRKRAEGFFIDDKKDFSYRST